MATQTVQFQMPSGVVVADPIAKIFLKGSDSIQESVVPVERTNSKGVWRADFTDAPAGTYTIVGFDATDPLSVSEVVLTLETATFFAGDNAEVLSQILTNQGIILASLTETTLVYTPQPDSDTINLTIGDAYDGVSNPKLTWEVAKSVDAATGVNFKVFDRRNNPIFDQTHGGVDTSDYTGTTVNVSLDPTATSLLLDESRDSYRVEVEVVFSPTSVWTISSAMLTARY